MPAITTTSLAAFRVRMEEADARFDEALVVILKAWTADEPFSHRGRYWQFDNIVVEPPTAQRPHSPIWMGAGGENSIAGSRRRGSTCCSANTPHLCPACLPSGVCPAPRSSLLPAPGLDWLTWGGEGGRGGRGGGKEGRERGEGGRGGRGGGEVKGGGKGCGGTTIAEENVRVK